VSTKALAGGNAEKWEVPSACGRRLARMLILGVILVLVAVALIVFGLASAAVSWLLWLGIALVVVAVLLVILDRTRARR
jgi:hypothetical protein